MKKRVYLISLIAILAIIGTIFYINKSKVNNKAQLKVNNVVANKEKASDNFITVTTKYFDKDTKNTEWTYDYTDKYDQTKHQWDFTNAKMYILNSDKWEEFKKPIDDTKSNVATVNIPKKNTGAYRIEVNGTKNNNEDFFDYFIFDCSKNQFENTEVNHDPKVEGDSIILTTKYFNKNIKDTVWTYQYTDKYDETKHQRNFKDSDLYVLRNGKWQITPLGETESPDNVSSVKLPKETKGFYHVDVMGFDANRHSGFYDKFDIDCSKIK